MGNWLILNFNVDQDEIYDRNQSRGTRRKTESNQMKLFKKKGPWDSAGCHWLDGPLICDRSYELGIEIDSISASNESTKPLEGNATRNKCVFCSHDPFSVNIETISLKMVPNERPLCPLSRSRSSGSNSSRFIASRSAALNDHHVRFDF